MFGPYIPYERPHLRGWPRPGRRGSGLRRPGPRADRPTPTQLCRPGSW